MSDYLNICAWVQTLLHTSRADLPDPDLYPWIESAIRALRAEFDVLPAYDALTDADRPAFDEAVGRLVAAKLRRQRAKVEARTDIVRVHTLNTHTQFATPASERKALEQQWVEDAYAALLGVSVIAALMQAARSLSLFRAAGPRRAQEARGVNTHSLNPLFTLLADEWDYERQNPGLFWWQTSVDGWAFP